MFNTAMFKSFFLKSDSAGVFLIMLNYKDQPLFSMFSDKLLYQLPLAKLRGINRCLNNLALMSEHDLFAEIFHCNELVVY